MVIQKPYKLIKICRLFIMWVLISAVGWCAETLWALAVHGVLTDRGLLALPLCPIYGTSALCVYLALGIPRRMSGVLGRRIQKLEIWKRRANGKAWISYAIYFLLSALVSTLAELIIGFAFNALGVSLWDYSDEPFNLFGIICLGYSIAWGVLITLFMELLWTRVMKKIDKIPRRALVSLSFTLLVPICVDAAVSALKALFGSYK